MRTIIVGIYEGTGIAFWESREAFERHRELFASRQWPTYEVPSHLLGAAVRAREKHDEGTLTQERLERCLSRLGACYQKTLELQLYRQRGSELIN